MPITFGSVGDIISVCLLVKDLVDALDKARGSKAEYQSLTRELWILDRVLLEIDLLARTHGGGVTPELEALCETARKAVDRCKELVTDFLKQIRKYQGAFGDGIKTNFVKETAMKMRWRIGEKDAVEKFRVEIAGTSASLQMLLATASVKLMDIKEKSVKDHITSIQKRNESTLTKHDTLLLAINDRLEDANCSIAAGNAVTSKIADALRLDWLRQLGTELKGFMRRIIAMNIATYHAVISIQASLPGRLERSLIEEPFILEDAIGRVAPVHLQFVTSWDAFHAVLEIRFKDMQGFKKVRDRQYGLQEKATRREIDQNRPWQRVFLPGQRIDMSFIFDATDDYAGKSSNVTCPGCSTPSNHTAASDAQCSYCGMWFRRITVIQETEPPPQVPVPAPWKSRSEFGKSGFAAMVSGQARPGKRRARPSEIEEDDMREFKRVRLIARQQRVRRHQFGVPITEEAMMTFANIAKRGDTEDVLLNASYSRGWGSSQTESFRTPRETRDIEDRDMIDVNENDNDAEELRREELLTKLTSEITAVSQYEGASQRPPASLVRESTQSSWSRPPDDEEPAWTLFERRQPRRADSQEKSSKWRSLRRRTPSMHNDKYSMYTHAPHFVFVNRMAPEYVSLANIKMYQKLMKVKFSGVKNTDGIWPAIRVTNSSAVASSLVFKPPGAPIRMVDLRGYQEGPRIQIPGTDLSFSGPELGSFVFDWTCVLCDDDYSVRQAWAFWNCLWSFENKRQSIVGSKMRDHLKSSRTYYGYRRTRDVYMANSHFMAWFPCFYDDLTSLFGNLNDFRFTLLTDSLDLYVRAFVEKFIPVIAGWMVIFRKKMRDMNKRVPMFDPEEQPWDQILV